MLKYNLQFFGGRGGRLTTAPSRGETAEQTRPIPVSNVSTDTTAYESTYGRKPRGTGTWFFFPDRSRNDYDGAVEIYGSYSNAVKEARKRFAAKGIGRFYVGT